MCMSTCLHLMQVHISKLIPHWLRTSLPGTSDSSGDRFKSNIHRVTAWPRWTQLIEIIQKSKKKNKKNQENSDGWMCFLINSVQLEKSRASGDYQCGNTHMYACFSSLHCHITILQYWPLGKLLKYKSSFNIPLAFHQSHPPPHSFWKERDIRCTFRMLKEAGVMPRLWKMPMTSFPFQTLEALSYPRSHIRSWLCWIQLYQKVKFIK